MTPSTTEQDKEKSRVVLFCTATLDSQFQWKNSSLERYCELKSCAQAHPHAYFISWFKKTQTNIKNNGGGASFLTFEFSKIKSVSIKKKGKLHSGHLSD